MLTQEMKKSIFNKASRSGFHHIITPARCPRHVAEAWFDGLGGVIMVSLSGGVMVLMRLLLIN